MSMPTMVPVDTVRRGDILYPEKNNKILPPGTVIMIALTPIDRHYLITLLGGREFTYRPDENVYLRRGER